MTTRDSSEVGPPPPFDPGLTATLDRLGPALQSGVTVENLPLMREGSVAIATLSPADLSRDGAFTVDERAIAGPPGAPAVPLLICRPTATEQPTAAIYHVHGGGMIMGTNRTGLPEILDWAQALSLAVVSVEYRLAPETPHPGPVEDCYAGLTWVATHPVELGIDPNRIFIVGASAGGGLSAAVSLMARDRGVPRIAGQMLMSPMLDDRNDTLSARQMTGLGVWDRAANETGWTALLGADRGGPNVSAYAAPARAADLSGLPPTFIDVGSAETFRDESVGFAERIWQGGGNAELHVWPGGCHGFDQMAPTARISVEARRARLNWLRCRLSA